MLWRFFSPPNRKIHNFSFHLAFMFKKKKKNLKAIEFSLIDEKLCLNL